MASDIKKTVQKHLVNRQYKLYKKRIAEQTISYDSWIRDVEEQERTKETLGGQKLSIQTVPYAECGACFKISDFQADIVVFHGNDGEPETQDLVLVAKYFEEHPEALIAYGDEDEIDENGVRSNPWLKPDWSPDTLISYFYFGNLFAVRRSAAREAEWLGENDWKRNLYDFCLKMVEINGSAGHMDSVLFHGKEKIVPFGQEESYNDLKKAAYERRGWPMKGSGKVSIIIPSKDNPGVLSACIHSVMEASTYRDFEIIVVDNGSSARNRARIERMRDMFKEEYRFVYHYEPMEFNFSRMCNIGVKMASGDYILLLNDDVEIIQDDWLEKMMEKAVLPHVGAVGVKLRYPKLPLIQHAGITNIHLGPAHLLQFQNDEHDYYFLRNRLAFDMIGVTGACLLVKKAIYEAAGGFCEELRVAFNDVEFCYQLHDMGYRNVVRNDVCLIHHESLSRGLDDNVEKVKRLHSELDLLYAKHPSVFGTDPYYHRYLVNDVLDREYNTANRYDFERRVEKTEPQKLENGLLPEWHNEVVRMGVDFAGDMEKWQTGKPGSGDYLIEASTFALHVDNCRYRFHIILKQRDRDDGPVRPGEDTAVWKLPCSRQYRPDMSANLPGFQNAELPGVCVQFERGILPSGEYLIGFLWEDTCSRQRLYQWSAELLMVE